jgi:methyl-accepting chemotaxis protein
LEGKLRIEAHRLETNTLLKGNRSVLILRKHEKDFFLRKDLGYIEKLKQEADTLQTTLQTLPESTEQKELIAIFNLYMATMDKVVEIESEIGLTKSQGARATINTLSERIQQSLTHVNNTYKDGTEQLIFISILIISGIFIFILGVILIALNKLVRPVFEPMHSIQEKAARISQGELSVQFNDLENNKVLKDLIVGFESIIAKFKNSMQLIEGIINRNIKEEIKLNSDNDEVGKTLNSIMGQVRTIDEEEQKRNWHNESLAKFAQVLRDSSSSSEQLYDSIITELVKNLGANQGAIYVVENDGNEEAASYLALKSCYAYNRKKFINKQIDLGEGLTGTCWAEGATIFLTEVPPDYINITSGLGEASPNSILLVPIKTNEHVLGVIELASFGMFAQYKLKFVEVLSESIGAAINTSNTNIKTLHLLQRSQEMTEELRSQEEEMRQNMEEMQATQEEMKRMTEAVQIEIQKLRAENEKLKAALNIAS